jgi:hypothetical protein
MAVYKHGGVYRYETPMVLMIGPRAASTGKNAELRARKSVPVAKIRQISSLWFMLKWPLLAIADSIRLQCPSACTDLAADLRLSAQLPSTSPGLALLETSPRGQWDVNLITSSLRLGNWPES